MKKILALTLVLLMLLPALIACGGDGDGTQTTNPNAPIVDPSGNIDYVSKLEVKDYSGVTFRVIGMKHTEQQYTNFEVASEGLTGDVMGDAVYRRNQALQQKYGFTIKADLFNAYEPDEVTPKMQSYFDSGDDMYDLCLFRPKHAIGFASTGYFRDLSKMPYLDFDHPTWDKNINSELTIGGKLFFTTNNFMLQEKMRTPCIFYNREMARSKGYLGNDEYFEEKYADTMTWTLDVFSQMVKEESGDGNGNGVGGEIDDRYGLAADTTGQFREFCIGAGFRYSTNENGVITINENNINMENIVAEVGKFYCDTTQVLCSYVFEPLSWYDAEDSFAAERSFFHSAFIGSYENLAKKADFEYGVLPFPLYDENQTRYYAANNKEFGNVFAIPYTVVEDEQAAYILEALSEMSHVTTFPTFIDTKVKVQDAYDKVSAKMLETIFDSVSYDIVSICDGHPSLVGLYLTVGAGLISAGNTDGFARLYDSKYDGAVEEMNEIMADFARLDE